MKTEKEIREQLKNMDNQSKNCHFLYEQTGNDEFEGRSMKSRIFVDALRWVLGEKEIEDEQIIMDTKTGETRTLE